MPKKPKQDSSFSQAMIEWHKVHGRKDLPWQLDNSAYHTWLSEVMLQQTQVKTVIPYYQSFTERFPNVHELAKAPIDEVLHLWTGLGYYSRARNLHKCAQVLSQDYQGEFPKTVEELEALPGIGRSTAGAILSLGMQIPAPILDGNVKRVFARFYCVEGWPGEGKVQKQLWEISENLRPEKDCKTYNQSLMDLGATVCKRSKPLCELCPLSPQCQAYAEHRQSELPHSKPKKDKPTKHCHMLILQTRDGKLLLEQRPAQGIWGGLWSFPEFADQQALNKHLTKEKIKAKSQDLEPIKHTFSHYHLMIQPVLCQIKSPAAKIGEKAELWYEPNGKNQQKVGLASPVKKLIQEVKNTL